MGKKILVGFVLLVACGAVYFVMAGRGLFGRHEGPGVVTPEPRSAARVQAAEAAVAAAARDVGVPRPKQVLFGDLHVHTTFSFDAFIFSLPLMGGEGAHPPADACDFARYCSALDFWSINDHAFSITPEHWAETIESIRQCNDVAGDPANPDTVAYLGWEWTQVGLEPDNHYGHKNVILRDLDDAGITARPIASQRLSGGAPPLWVRGFAALGGDDRMQDLVRYWTEWRDTPNCADGVNTRDLPSDCIEAAETPAALFRKLDEWGVASIVIPHGTTWGFYSPPGATWDKQLTAANRGDGRQNLFEIYSGHGDSEVYRDFLAVEFGEDGKAVCPEPSEGYLPTCWRAGEIIRERCLQDGAPDAECAERARITRGHAVAARVAVHRTVPGATIEDWLDAGQCTDCREPAFNYRPGGSAQYVMAIGNFDGPEPAYFRMGFMSSSDNHFARPGTGYKEVYRRGMTESQQPDLDLNNVVGSFFLPPDEEPASESVPFSLDQAGFDVFEVERQASFLTTGGLIAAHSAGRDRGAIWDAMQRREVYGTTGPRILLWFDLLNPPGSRGSSAPMGAAVEMGESPIFQVRAVGSFEQKPGCPDGSGDALGPDRLERLCKGECYHPSDDRRAITRIEVVRIRPPVTPDEDVARLIEDPWKVFQCEPDPTGCVVTFTDSEFEAAGRNTLYYARAFEEPKLGVNAGNLRCERDAAGKCVDVNACPGPEGAKDDCLAPHEPRAWSSPIWIDVSGA
ncbi:MAG: DUF3604 domain-containing protein [Myxococcota bacterium]|nr:DUF3604 domain-containing protein [Myxococcota bacterium]